MLAIEHSRRPCAAEDNLRRSGGAATAAEVGSFRVVGSSGAEPIHALPFANDLLLFLQRGSNGNGTSYTPALQVG